MQSNALANDFNGRQLIKYTIPTIIMMLFMSTYTIVDGIFVANFVNEDALSAVNIVFPIIILAGAVGMMLAIGANAVVSKVMGEGHEEQARGFFTFVYLIGGLFGIVSTALILPFADVILPLLGTNDVLDPYAESYFYAVIPFMSMLFLQVFTQVFFITAGVPQIGFFACFAGGMTNIALDFVFIALLDLGIVGAGIATGLGATVPAVFGIVYFAVMRRCTLHFVRPLVDLKRLASSMYNGMSEFVTNIAASITMFMFNVILMRIAGEAGVAAITVIMYIQMIQMAIYTGYSIGVSPVIGYKFGQQNRSQLHKISVFSLKLVAVASIATTALSLVFAELAVGVFISPDSPTFDMAVQGFRIFSVAYIFMGFNIYGSALFTALSNGKVSAILSVTRTLVLLVTLLLLLPQLFGIIGVWLAVPVAELLSVGMFYYAFKKNKEFYGY